MHIPFLRVNCSTFVKFQFWNNFEKDQFFLIRIAIYSAFCIFISMWKVFYVIYLLLFRFFSIDIKICKNNHLNIKYYFCIEKIKNFIRPSLAFSITHQLRHNCKLYNDLFAIKTVVLFNWKKKKKIHIK